MIEQGTLKEISAAELLLKGFSEELTGVLYLKREEILKELYLKHGKIVWAVSNSDVDTIENILVSDNKVDAQTISLLKSESKNTIDLGKSLVEKGIITFEEFVEYSKGQLNKILLSVLKWGDGVYYFSKDVPAETYISLEVNLKDFVHSFIMNNLDMGFVWTRIGSLHEELQKTKNDELIKKFDLPKQELELLDKFSGDLSIEMISLNYPGMAKEDILKAIYFFISAGLLIEKSEHIPEPLGESVLVTEENNNKNINFPDSSSVNDDLDRIVFDDEEEPVGEYTFGDVPEVREEVPVNSPTGNGGISGGDEGSLTDQLLEEMKHEEGKKKSKLVNILLLLVLFSFVIAGLIFLLLSPEERSMLIPGLGNNSEKVEDVSEKKITANTVKSKDELKKPVNEEKVDKKENVPLLSSDKKVKPDKQKVKKEIPKRKDIKNTEGQVDPFKFFTSGNIIKAGNIWKKNVISQKKRFSILLELDCLKASVKNAFNKADNREKFFILNTERNGRNCFLVLFGLYSDKEDAEKSLRSVPSYFWKQENPPKSIDLTNYL